MAINSSQQKVVENNDILSCHYPNFNPKFMDEPDNSKAFKVCLVLGQSLNKDGSVPRTLEFRVKAAANVFQKYNELNKMSNEDSDFLIIATGGDPARTGTSEAKVMKKILMENFHISEKNILLEDKSYNTMENAYFSYKILIDNLGKIVNDKSSTINLALITSDFHMPRSLYLFEAVFSALFKEEIDVFDPVKYSKHDQRFINYQNASSKPISCRPKVVLHPCPCNSGCPPIQKKTREDVNEGKSYINKFTLLQRLYGEQTFLRNEVVPNLNRHILEGRVHVKKLSDERMIEAQRVVDYLIDHEKEKMKKLQESQGEAEEKKKDEEKSADGDDRAPSNICSMF